MTLLALDYGAKKVGVAKSDEQNKMALPLTTVRYEKREQLLEILKSISNEYGVERIIVGVPVSLSAGNGEPMMRNVDLENKQMQEVLVFVEWLRGSIEVPVEVEDERLSTKMANSLLKGLVGAGPDDAVAAMLILQTYLDRKNSDIKSRT